MVESNLARRTGFAGLAVPGRHGRIVGDDPQVVVAERAGLRIAQVASHHGHEQGFAEAVRAAVGVAPPSGPKRAVGDGIALIGIAPSEWLAIGEGARADALFARLAHSLSGLASCVDQSDAKAVLRLSGAKARDVLAKGCMLDLDSRAFRPNDFATTPVGLIPCQLWLIDEAPAFELAVPLSYARSFWSWLSASAAAFGYEVKEPIGG